MPHTPARLLAVLLLLVLTATSPADTPKRPMTFEDLWAVRRVGAPSRMAAAGGSYGGYMMAWVNGHTDRFKALVCHAVQLAQHARVRFGQGPRAVARRAAVGQ